MASKGIEWVNKYHGYASTLFFNGFNARGFYNTLNGIKKFNWGNDLAWDQDFEQINVGSPSTGTDHIYIDTVDIAYFSGHGTASYLLFGVNNRDNRRARHTEMRLGDINLEWIVFDGCETLENINWGAFDRWIQVFNGLHMILGFGTTCTDMPNRGQRFALWLNFGFRIKDAWIMACKETEFSSTKWAYMHADNNQSNTSEDHWWGKGFVSPDPVNPNSFGLASGPC